MALREGRRLIRLSTLDYADDDVTPQNYART